MIEVQERQVIDQPTPEESAAQTQAAYDKIASNGREPARAIETERIVEVERATETPPDKPDEMAELRKRLDDVNGRYGRLSQKLEETLAKIATPDKTQSAAVASTADLDEILKEVKEVFGDDEMYTSLKSAFSKARLGGGGVDLEGVGKFMEERATTAKAAQFESSLSQVLERHDDFYTAKASPAYKRWTATLSPGDRSALNRSEDPGYVGDMIDEYKVWATADAAKATHSTVTHQKTQSTARLAAAVLPTSGTKQSVTGEPGANEQVQSAYNRVAGKRL